MIHSRTLLIAATVSALGCYRPIDRFGQHSAGGYFGGSCTGISVQTKSAYFSTPATGNGDIYCASFKTRSFQPVCISALSEYTPVVSSDNELIAYGRRSASGKSLICLKSNVTNEDYTLIDSIYDYEPRSFSTDRKYLIVQMTKGAGGLAKKVEHLVIDIKTKFITRVGRCAAFNHDSSCVLYIDKHNGISYAWSVNVATGVRSTLCPADFVLPVARNLLLISGANNGVAAIDRNGVIVKRFAALNSARVLSVAGKYVAGSVRDDTGLIIENFDRDADAGDFLPLPFANAQIDSLNGSDEGFVIIVRHKDIGSLRRESVCAVFPPFTKIVSQFSLSELLWDAEQITEGEEK